MTDLKWDTIMKKRQLHAIDRNGHAQHIQYHVAISIEAPKYAGSLYDAILQTYQNR